MAVKTSGAEFKLFYDDVRFWPQDDGKTWHDDEVITVNGVMLADGVDTEAMPDDAAVTVEGGMVFGPQWDGDEPSLEAYFKRWRKLQTTRTVLVECDASNLDAVKAAVKAAGGRVVT